jgi:general secretion pathway protein K
MSRQRGVILISALIVTALAAVVAATLFFDTGLSARRTAASFSLDQALQIGQGAEALAAQILSDDTGQTDTPQDDWAQPVEPVEVDTGITLEAMLVEQNGRFNLNSLVSADGTPNENAMKVFQRLLQLAELDVRFADAIADWIDPDTQPGPSGAEDGFYLSQTPPHRTGNLGITSLSELMQLPGLTPGMYETLKQHVTALPASVRSINVCMADGIVLDALFALHEDDQMHQEYSTLSAEELAERRQGDCYPQRSVLTSGQPAMAAMAAERSSWFVLQTWVSIGTSQFALYSLMQREGAGQVRTITRSLGTE